MLVKNKKDGVFTCGTHNAILDGSILFYFSCGQIRRCNSTIQLNVLNNESKIHNSLKQYESC